MEKSISMKPEGVRFTESPRLLLIISMVSMVMLFAGLTSGYIVRQGQGNWVLFNLPTAFYFSTVIILISSVTMHWAILSVKNNNLPNTRTALLMTLTLGLGFCFTQFLGWSQLVAQGIYFVGNPSGSFMYVITALHVAHMVAAIIYLIFVNVKTLSGKYNSQSYLGISLAATFWHFLDVLWIYLFVFLLLVR